MPAATLAVVSTHSRPKAAGNQAGMVAENEMVSTHSRPKAAGQRTYWNRTKKNVSTHSRPKAAGFKIRQMATGCVGFNTQPPEGGWVDAAKREIDLLVSTHSRPKAAGECKHQRHLLATFQHTAARRRLGKTLRSSGTAMRSFNTQPPEGGWVIPRSISCRGQRFNTQPPEGGWEAALQIGLREFVSTHSRPKAAGPQLT